MTEILKNISGGISAFAFFLWGADPTNINWLKAFFVICMIDIMIGSLQALKEHTFQRQILFTGFCKKLIEFGIIAAAHQIDVIGIVGDNQFLQKAATGYYIGYEAISVMSHANSVGVPIPPVVRKIAQSIATKFGLGDINK